MRIFLTGGTGFIGTTVVRELLSAGHSVIGLARSDSSAQSLVAAGASVLHGSLDDLDSLRRGASSADAVIHIAFVHNFADFLASVETDRRAIEALGEALAGTNRPFIVTSGVPTGTPGRPVTESDDSDPRFPRASESAALPFAARGVLVSIVRPSRLVHGEGDVHGFIPQLIAIARQKGVSAYVGDGRTRVHAVHRLDVGALFRVVLEKASEAGGRYQAVADEGITFREVAEAIGRGANVPVASITQEEAQSHFGFLAMVAATDNPASSAFTQQTLGWKPTRPGLLEDLAKGFYFSGK